MRKLPTRLRHNHAGAAELAFYLYAGYRQGGYLFALTWGIGKLQTPLCLM